MSCGVWQRESERTGASWPAATRSFLALQLQNVAPLVNRYDKRRSAWRSLSWAIGLVTASMLLLSAARIYALMSFTVAQRTREIGIRTAPGAQPRP